MIRINFKHLTPFSNTIHYSKEKQATIKIIIIYLLISLCWVFISDWLIAHANINITRFKLISSYKGSLCVLITACALYHLIYSNMKRIIYLEYEVKNRDAKNKYIVDTITNGIWEWNTRTNEAYFSPKLKKILGYNDYEIENSISAWRALIHPADIELVITKFHECVQGLTNEYRAEYRIKNRSGKYKWLETHGVAVHDHRGKVIYIVGTHTDITERKSTMESLQESEKKFRMIFHNVSDQICMVDLSGNSFRNDFLEVNNAMCNALGYTRDELLKMSLKDIRPKETHQELDLNITTLLNKKHYTFETYQLTKDAHTIPVEINAHVFHMNGKCVGLSIARDITERRKAEEELEQMMLENAQLLKQTIEYDILKTEFFSNISHELKTPLNIIFSAIQMILLYADNESAAIETKKVIKYIKTMKQNCFRLLRLINNLIDITKIDAGFFKLNPQNLNIVELVESISLSVADYIKDKNIKFIFDTDLEERIIACDPDMIERIILNLLSNAVKFTSSGDMIEVNIKNTQSAVLISIKDTGIGIPEDKQQIIFERFRQADSLLTRNHEGSGIGLSLVKSLVELHNGKISLKSKYDNGSEFIVELPVILSEEINLSMHNTIDNEKVKKIQIEFSDIYS